MLKNNSTKMKQAIIVAAFKQDFGDTWAELALGGTWKIGGSSLFYADITRSFGGDYEMQWKLNAGIRYAF